MLANQVKNFYDLCERASMRLTMRRIITSGAIACAGWGVVGIASASSPDAWKVLYDTTADACLKQSGLKKPKVVEGPVLFSNAILYKIKGTWPQAHMKGKKGKVYCSHPYPNGAPEIVDAP